MIHFVSFGEYDDSLHSHKLIIITTFST